MTVCVVCQYHSLARFSVTCLQRAIQWYTQYAPAHSTDVKIVNYPGLQVFNFAVVS